MQDETKLRLDELLVRRGAFATRSRARDAIERGAVRVDGRVAAKPGLNVPNTVPIAVDDPAAAYVSRAALKLIAGLDGFGFDPAGLVALDLGASSGGFTQVLLERGAARVWAVDVGHGQIDAKLRADPRVQLVVLAVRPSLATPGESCRHLGHLGRIVGSEDSHDDASLVG